MPISSSIKGIQSIRSLKNVGKSAIPNKEDSDFIKLYVYEKERVRLKTEEIRILQRLDIIQTRLKEIQAFTNIQVEALHVPDPDNESTKPKKENKKDDESEWKTLSIDY